MENIVFLQPWLGILAFFVGIVGIFLYYRTQKFAPKFAFMQDIEAIFWKTKFLFLFNIILLCLIMSSFSLLIANPNIKTQQKKVIKNGIDIAIVLDLSLSMEADDIKPNRIEVAKQVISDFIKELKTDRVGLILFAWKPFTSIPLTFDYNFLINNIKDITTTDTIKQLYDNKLQWTAIWEWLLYWANLFDDTDREKIIVLLSDWKPDCWDFNFDGKMDCIDPIEAVRYLREKNIKIHTVWIWWEWEVYIKYTPKPVTFDTEAEENLKTLAKLTNWLYYRADSEETFKQIFEKLNLLQKKEIEVEKYEFYTPYYKNFVLLIFALLILYMSVNTYYYLRK